MKKVVVAGHICLDITPAFQTKKEFSRVEDILIPGKLINMDQVTVYTGGCVANTGFAFKKLGADVKLMGKVGDDNFGKTIQDICLSHGADGLIVDKDVSTSYSIVVAIPGVDRFFLHHTGANDTFKLEDIADDELKGADLFHFGYPPLMRSMYENDGAELIRILRHVHELGIHVSLDMASVDPNSDAGRVNWRELIKNVAPYLDYFVPSLDEIQYMLGDKSAEELVDELYNMGVKTVMIKCGTDGIYYRNGLERGHVDAIKAPFVASATGAGDTSIAAFLLAMIEGRDIRTSAKLAAAQGCCCVMAYDSFSSLKTFEELEKMIMD